MTYADSLSVALAAHKAGKVYEARTIYERILAKEPKNATALHYLGLAWMHDGDLDRADKLVSRAVALDAGSANALADLGAIKAKRKEYESSVEFLSRVLRMQPTHNDALRNLATVFEQVDRPELALPLLEKLLELFPDSASTLFRVAQTCFKLGDARKSASLLQDALEIDPSFCEARVLLGDVLEAFGRFALAKAQYLHVLRRKPHHAIALAKLLQLRDTPISSVWPDRANAALLDKSLPQIDYVRLRVAMGFYYDREGKYDVAFENFHAGYKLQHDRDPFNNAAYSAVIDRLVRSCSRDSLARTTCERPSALRPIFIFGMPRSGTTLVEQILASHPAVAAGGELPALMAIASQYKGSTHGGQPYPEGLKDITAEQLEDMSQKYLSCLSRISDSAARVTDKQPFNYMHLGLAQLLFPKATFIHCQRDPIDTCLSCYFVSFADSFAFANDLRTLGRYYLDYARLMAHWRKVVPTAMLEVRYETLVIDFETVVRQIVAHCGLPWDDACLKFYETRRSVRTPSRWQVRQPIYPNSIGRWKRYARHLGPLVSALQNEPDQAAGRGLPPTEIQVNR